PLFNAENFHKIGDKGKAPGGGGEMQMYTLKVVKKLAEIGKYDPYRDAIIVPQNKGMIGTVMLNEYLVTMFNPEKEENGIKVNKRMRIHTGRGEVYFAIGDKVMITSN